jgi:dTDP-4-amino-4,6-dideoxygalactose transaminase
MTIRLGWPDVGAEEAAAVAEVLASGQLTMGPKVGEFECEIAGACGVPYAVAVANGTAALHLAAMALGLGPGDEVIVPAYTFPATANAVALTGATPVLVDVDPATMNIDIDAAYRAVTPRTKAVLAVHLFGNPVDWEALASAVPPDVQLLEDAAGALGATWRGMPCGGLGVMGCFSFHPRKTVTTGEGGAVTTHSEELDAALRRLRHHGIEVRDGVADIPQPSTNYRLSDIQCAIGIPQMRRLPELLAMRRRIAAGYEERLAGLAAEGRVLLPAAAEGDEHGFQAYVIQLDRRDEALTTLRAEGIEVQIGTYAVNQLSAYRHQGSRPGAELVARRALALPLHSHLSDADLDAVVAGVARFA